MDGKEKTEENRSVWAVTVERPAYPPLAEDLHADVCVVGAGIAGLTTAYLLTREGRSVVVLDDGPVGGGMTEVTTAHLANALDDRYVEIERLHGEEGARLAAESHSAAIDRIEANVRTEGIDCDFTRLDGFSSCGREIKRSSSTASWPPLGGPGSRASRRSDEPPWTPSTPAPACGFRIRVSSTP